MSGKYWVCPNCFAQNDADDNICIVCDQRTTIVNGENNKSSGYKPGAWTWLLRALFLGIILYYCIWMFLYYNIDFNVGKFIYNAGNSISYFIYSSDVLLEHISNSFHNLNLSWVPHYYTSVYNRVLSSQSILQGYSAWILIQICIVVLWTCRTLTRKYHCIRKEKGTIIPLFLELIVIEFLLACMHFVISDSHSMIIWIQCMFEFSAISLIAHIVIFFGVMIIRMITRHKAKASETRMMFLSLLLHIGIMYVFH